MAAPLLFEPICDGQRQLAMVVRHGPAAHKYNFATAAESALQLGVSVYSQGEEVLPHAHHPRHEQTRDSQEFILVQEGAVDVSVLREDGSLVRSVRLNAGDGVLFQQGGHACRFLEPTRILEIKQGPYLSPQVDKYPLPRTTLTNPGPASH